MSIICNEPVWKVGMTEKAEEDYKAWLGKRVDNKETGYPQFLQIITLILLVHTCKIIFKNYDSYFNSIQLLPFLLKPTHEIALKF